MIAKVSERGQISIPAAARRKVGIKPNSNVSVEVSDKEIVIRPIKSISELGGIFHEYARGKSTDWEEIRSETERIVAEEVENECRR